MPMALVRVTGRGRRGGFARMQPGASSVIISTTDRRAPEVAMDKNPSPKAAKSPQAFPEAPFTTFIQLDGKSSVPSQFNVAGAFTITRLQSPVGLADRITKLSPVPA